MFFFSSKYLCTEILIKISTDQTTFIIFYSSLPIHVWTENMGSDRNLMSLCFYMYQTVCTILITPYIVIYIYNLKSHNLLHCPHVPKQRNCVSSFYKLYSLYCIVTSFLYNVTQGNLLGDSFSIFLSTRVLLWKVLFSIGTHVGRRKTFIKKNITSTLSTYANYFQLLGAEK